MDNPEPTRPSVWSGANFRRFIIINSIETLAIGMVMAVLPLLISEKFGSGDELVMSSALLIVPRVIFAPIIGDFLLKKGPKLIACITMAGLAGIFLSQALLENYWLFQGTIVLRALIGMACVASLMTLQAWTIPKGQNLEANGVYLATSRVVFFSAPFLVKLGQGYVTTEQFFYIIAGFFVVASSLTLSLSFPSSTSSPSDAVEKNTTSSYTALIRLFRQKTILFRLFMPLFGYFILTGIYRLFLLWTTIHVFHYPKASYLSLLTAQGAGNILFSLIAAWSIKKLTRKLAMTKLYSVLRILSILSFIALTLVPSFYGIMIVLMLGVLPQTMATICFYTLLQKHLTKQEQSVVHTLTFPICQFFGLLGNLLAFTYTHNYLSLTHFWLLAGAIALSIALLPWLGRLKNEIQEENTKP